MKSTCELILTRLKLYSNGQSNFERMTLLNTYVSLYDCNLNVLADTIGLRNTLLHDYTNDYYTDVMTTLIDNYDSLQNYYTHMFYIVYPNQ